MADIDKSDLYSDLRPVAGNRHLDDVRNLMVLACNLHEAKENVYKLSFCRRGIVGIWMNVSRKYDRIDAMASEENYRDFTFIDTLFDVAVYALKFVAILRKLYPAAFDKWLKNVYCEYTGIVYEEVVETMKLEATDER